MCKALDDLIEQGVERGIKQGMERGMERGIKRGKLLDLQSLMETLHLSLEQAMNALKIPQEERESLIKMINM